MSRWLGPRASLALALALLLGAGLLRYQLGRMDPLLHPISGAALKGFVLYLAGAYAPAARAYRQHVLLDEAGPVDPRSTDAVILAAVSGARGGDDDRAIDAFNATLRRNAFGGPVASLAVLELAGELADRPAEGRPYAVLAQLYRYLRVLDPSNGRLAVSAAREAIRRGHRAADAYLVIAVIAEKEERMMDALAAYQQATLVDPRYAEGYRRQSIIHAWQGDLARQYQTIRTAFELVPTDAIYLYELETAVLDRLGDAPAAVQLMRRAVEADPGSHAARRALGSAYTLLGDYEPAIAQYREAVRLAPHDAEGWRGLGWAFDRRGDYPGAMAAYEEAVRRDPGEPSTHAALGAMYGRQRRPRDAVVAYARAVELGDRQLTTLVQLCVARFDSGDFARANACFHQVLQRAPDNPTARRYLIWSARNAQGKASP